MKVIKFIKQKKAIIVADDFTMSEGVDESISKLLEQNRIHYTSTLVTSDRFKNLISNAKQINNIKSKIGLHLDFTFGKAVSIKEKSLITDDNGYFNKGFIHILYLSIIKSKQLQSLVAQEIKSQIELLQQIISTPTHIDGHQHIHMIPLIWKTLDKINQQYKIPRIRFINESIFRWQILNIFNIKNTAKLILLKILGFFCKNKCDLYFVSILNTCKISNKIISTYKVPKKYKKIEIMIHPGDSKIDRNNQSKERIHLTSKLRDKETRSINII